MEQFRFQTQGIWEEAITIADPLLDISDRLERRRYFRFADQMRGAAMSISNNIAEGSGSASSKVFARGSVFENANILNLLNRRKQIPDTQADELISKLERLSRRITSFKKSLKT